jgi:site-specific recombinase XerD
MLALENVIFSNFIDSLKSPVTKQHYSSALKEFMKFHRMTNYSELLTTNRENLIKEFIVHLAKKGVSKSKFTIVFAALKNFYEMNDIEDIKWKKLRRRGKTRTRIQTLLS